MTMRIELNGSAELKAALANMSEAIEKQVGDEVSDVAAEMEADIVLSIQQGPASGRIYKRGGVVHQASAPGEAPMSDTGALASSIYSEMLGPISAAVGTRMDYANHLEYGTISMHPRPFFRPVVEEYRETFTGRVASAIARASK